MVETLMVAALFVFAAIGGMDSALAIYEKWSRRHRSKIGYQCSQKTGDDCVMLEPSSLSEVKLLNQSPRIEVRKSISADDMDALNALLMQFTNVLDANTSQRKKLPHLSKDDCVFDATKPGDDENSLG